MTYPDSVQIRELLGDAWLDALRAWRSLEMQLADGWIDIRGVDLCRK